MSSGVEIAKLYASLSMDTKAFESALNRSDGLISGVGNTLGTFVKVGIGAAVAGFAAISAGLLSCISTGAAFDKTISGAGAVLNATNEQMDKLSSLAMQLGKDTVFSASEAGSAIEKLGQNGLEYQDIMNGAAKATVDLAAATGTDLTTSADIASSAMSVWGIKAADMGRAVDQISGVANASRLSMQGYAEAAAAGAGVFQAAGGTFEDFNAILAATSAALPRASDQGTSLKTFMQSLIPQSEDAADAFRKMGLFTGMTGDEMDKAKGKIAKYEAELAGLDPTSKNYERNADELKNKILGLNASLKQGKNAFFDEQGRFVGGAKAAELLKNALSGLSDEQKTALTKSAFGSDASRMALALAQVGAAGIDAKMGIIASTSAAEQAAKRSDNLAGDLEQLSGSFDTLKITIAHAFNPLARKVVQFITSKLNALLGMDFKPFAARFERAWDKVQGVITRVIGLFDRFASKSAGGLPSILSGLGSVFGEWAADIWSWIEPGLSGAIAKIANWIRNPSESTIGTALSTGWDWFTRWASAIWDYVGPKLGELFSALSSWIIDPAKRSQLWNGIVSAWNVFATWAGEIWNAVSPYLASFWSYLTSWVTDDTKRGQLWAGIVSVWNVFSDWAVKIWDAVSPYLASFWGYLVSWVTDPTKSGQLWAGIVAVWNVFESWASAIATAVSPYLTEFWSWLTSWVTDSSKRTILYNGLVTGWTFFADWAQYIGSAVAPYLSEFWSWLTSWVTDDQKRAQLWNGIIATWSFIWDWAKYITGAVSPYMVMFWNYLTSWVTDPAKRTILWNGITSTWTAFGDWAASIWNGADGKSGVSKYLMDLWTNMNSWLLTHAPQLQPWETAFSDFIVGAHDQWIKDFPEMKSNFVQFSSDITAEVKNLGQSFTSLWDTIFGKFDTPAKMNGSNFISGLTEFFSQIEGTLLNSLKFIRLLVEALDYGLKAWKAGLSFNYDEYMSNAAKFMETMSAIGNLNQPAQQTNSGTPSTSTTTGAYDPNNPNAVVDQSTQAPGKAGGGPVVANQSYMTGEHGRELFVPQSSGYIYNANDTQGIGDSLSGVSSAARAIKDFASSLANFVFPKSEPMSAIQSAAMTNGASQTDTQTGAYNAESTAALMNTRTSRIELVVTGDSSLPMDRQKLRELAIMLGRELNLSGALLTMG